MADDTKQPDVQTDDQVTEAHLNAYEQTSNDPNLARLLRHLGSELMKLRGGGSSRRAATTSTPPGAEDKKGDS